MRSMVFVYLSSMIAVILIAMISFITMKSSYMEALESNMDDAIVHSVKMLQTDRDKGINSLTLREMKFSSDVAENELTDFKQNFVEYLAGHLDEKLTHLDVEIFGADDINGMISVQLTGYYMYPFGVEDHVSTYKTVILDKYLKTDYNDVS